MGTAEIISLLGIVGTLLGTVAGTVLQFLIKKQRRRRREDQTRFRTDLYAACMNLYYLGKHAVERPETPTLGLWDSDGEGTSEFTGADKDVLVEALWRATTRITLLGSTTLHDATQHFVEAVIPIVHEGEADEERRRYYQGASDRFLRAARAKLGVELRRGSSLP